MTTTQAFPEWQHCFTATKPYPEPGYKPGTTITVKAGLHYLRGNSRPYFSVTASVQEPRERDISAGGCMHAEILKYWPELAPIVALHLADDDGAPMHSEANGWYWLAGYYGGAGEEYHGGNSKRQHWNPDRSFNGYRESTPDECLEVFAEHVRVTVDAARALADSWRTLYGEAHPERWMHARGAFRRWLNEQAARMADDARAAIVLLDALRERKP